MASDGGRHQLCLRSCTPPAVHRSAVHLSAANLSAVRLSSVRSVFGSCCSACSATFPTLRTQKRPVMHTGRFDFQSTHAAHAGVCAGADTDAASASALLLGVALHQAVHGLGWCHLAVQQIDHGGGNRHVHTQRLGAGQHGAGAVHAFGHMA